MVVEQLPELEDIETGLTEDVVQEASDLNNEWKHHVHLSNDHPNIIVPLENWTGLFQNWESVRDLESGHNQIKAEK